MSFNQRFTTLDSLQGKVFNKALELGFIDCTFAEVQDLDSEFAHFEDWIERGYAGTMHYLTRDVERRKNPTHLLPDAQTVVVVAYPYYTPYSHDSNQEYGKVSRYAWGDDYHDVIPPKLQELADFIRQSDETSQTRCYTDTGAILEKQWAVKSGLGWQGKNSNIINRNYGSFFFIGVILTTARISATIQTEDMCGTCTACIDACPTKAIVEPYVVDGTKCISYWTIETKPEIEIPINIATNLDGWLFGCDVCQDVCPWNRFKKNSTEQYFLPRNEETGFILDWVLNLSQEEFSSRFRKSPIKRTKRAGLQRNARALQQCNETE